MAERIGNLLGQLRFSDDQLQQTQKGLDNAGVAMPNFGNVGKELAREINEEPEVEIETDDERMFLMPHSLIGMRHTKSS
jgi:Ras GTPase-activating-like protein IQGAP2/3